MGEQADKASKIKGFRLACSLVHPLYEDEQENREGSQTKRRLFSLSGERNGKEKK